MRVKTKTLPVLVNRRGVKRTIEVRKESELEIMHDCLRAGKSITLRVLVQVRDMHGNYMGWHGASWLEKFWTIGRAQDFVKNFKERKHGNDN